MVGSLMEKEETPESRALLRSRSLDNESSRSCNDSLLAALCQTQELVCAGPGRVGRRRTKLVASLAALLLAGVGATTVLVASKSSREHARIYSAPAAASDFQASLLRAFAPKTLQEVLPFDKWVNTYKVTDPDSDLAKRKYRAYAHHPVFLQDQARMNYLIRWQISHKCPKQEDGVDFQSSSSFDPLPNVDKPYYCQKACTETPGCTGFSWGSAATNETGLRHVCSRKSVVEGATIQKHPVKGVVSGLACDRQGGDVWWPLADSQYYDLPKPTMPVYLPAHLLVNAMVTTMMPAIIPQPANATQAGGATQPVNASQPASATLSANMMPSQNPMQPVSATQPRPTQSVNTTQPASTMQPVSTEQPTDAASDADAAHKNSMWPGKVIMPSNMTQMETAARQRNLMNLKTEVPAPGLSSMLCIVLFRLDSYEQDLLVAQHQMNASLFQCDKYAIYSSQVVEIAPGLVSRRIPSTMLAEVGGQFGTVLNLGVFMALWRQVVLDADFMNTDWTLKLDPDTVFFAWRLRPILDGLRPAILKHSSKYGGNGIYLNNCGQGLHGPVEVLSQDAVRAFVTHAKQCGLGLDAEVCKTPATCAIVWNGSFRGHCNGPCTKWWGEDIWVDQCLSRFTKAKRVFVPELLVEDHCSPPLGWRHCNDTTAAAFHPFKKLDEYKECWDMAHYYEKTLAALAPLS